MSNQTTRIKKYEKLRTKVQQEIKLLTLKNENLKEINQFQKKLNKIDKNIFIKSSESVAEIFGNFNNLMNIEHREKKTGLDDFKKNLENANLDIEKKIEEIKREKTKIEDYVPELGNENLINNQIEKINKDQKKIEKKFQEMILNKKAIIEMSKKVDPTNFEKIEFFGEILKNQNKIENKANSIEFWKDLRKKQTKWLLWSNLLFFVLMIVCFVLLIFLK